MLRSAVVAGQFYPGVRDELAALVADLTRADQPPSPAFGCIAPHAGYVYSGRVAGMVFSQVEVPGTVILLNPNHTGEGVRAALWESGSWRTPLGDVPVDSAVALLLKQQAPILEHSPRAHLAEHSAEVQLPFLQIRNPSVKIVPICLMGLSWEHVEMLARAIAEVVRRHPGDILVAASSDMNHYQSEDVTRRKDRMAIERVMSLDPQGLLQTVERERISMCGALPAAVLLHAARLYGVRSVREVAYDTSGSVSGNHRQVVGYFGAVLA